MIVVTAFLFLFAFLVGFLLFLLLEKTTAVWYFWGRSFENKKQKRNSVS
jgi:hypothetical protein